MVVAQPGGERSGVVVLARHQSSTALVTHVGLLRSAAEHVVVESARRAQATGQHATGNLFVRHLEQDHPVEVVALEKELGLPRVAREAVDDEAVVPVVIVQPLAHDRLHQFVVDELADGHDSPYLGAELGVLVDVPPEDVANRDVDQIEVGGEQLGLGAFPTALDAHDHVLHHRVRAFHRFRGNLLSAQSMVGEVRC